MTIPNILTVFRILLTPFFIFFLFNESESSGVYSLIIFTVASFTDAYDGYYARKYNAVSESGKFLDPLADKILASSAFISFAVLGLIDIWMVAIIILRDLFVTLLRMRMKKGGESLVTSNIAKSKTAAQLITIIFTLIYLSINNSTVPILDNLSGQIDQFNLVYNLTFIVSLFTVFTGYMYVKDNFTVIKKIIFK
ncbi:MAG: CDP-diacylglycerol--glycerol-3-phosphate 3-phosphatidyltransferase [Candidatus Marinimicrobia bacterium]|jgi:CDP-diacylglycerol--glycerol-3-phosphate 3-phosphatidyltransferase|nr:CDP-diacylglycerol--glycerol-3-phosphate 3-phosphatidyltransferase [Candidatus Neomarinimicrobiota bacterium]MEC8703818.1 CDP-diacylglycerol--glycerol-3-phosphate 3-phosphatidyltransferase [Candidatus Neomarinimicrobiota bacterium]|tara:strand:- start:535 stop:1119 length:585 start_codon:yes stop_codon:yes gene_type:complete